MTRIPAALFFCPSIGRAPHFQLNVTPLILLFAIFELKISIGALRCSDISVS